MSYQQRQFIFTSVTRISHIIVIDEFIVSDSSAVSRSSAGAATAGIFSTVRRAAAAGEKRLGVDEAGRVRRVHGRVQHDRCAQLPPEARPHDERQHCQPAPQVQHNARGANSTPCLLTFTRQPVASYSMSSKIRVHTT